MPNFERQKTDRQRDRQKYLMIKKADVEVVAVFARYSENSLLKRVRKVKYENNNCK